METMERDSGQHYRDREIEAILERNIQFSALRGYGSVSSQPPQVGVARARAGLQGSANGQQNLSMDGPSGGNNHAGNCVSLSIANQQASERIWRCSMCPETFEDKATMKLHCKSHGGLRKYMCLRCPKQFRNAEACNIHYNAHYVLKHYFCGRCDKEFAKRANLIKHQQMHVEMQSRQKKGRWSCNHCSKYFSKKRDWEYHRIGLPCLERKRVTARLRESCRKLTELVNSLDSSPDSLFEACSSTSYNALDAEIPDTTNPSGGLTPPGGTCNNSDSEGSIEDNNCTGPESEDSEFQISSTTRI